MQVPEFAATSYRPIGKYSTAFDAEIAAIRITLSQLLCHTDRVSKLVILSDSMVTFEAISSFKAPILVDVLKCQQLAIYFKAILTLPCNGFHRTVALMG
ncbi:hypothetical protein TNCV_2042931 [Trichonephila clavipes]|nr:hypothetical protein TNCV_2042931 [Trichonephila clavipes]